MVDLDFGDLLTEIGGRVKRKPHGRPEQQALPSEQAIGDLVKGAEEAISIPANYSDGTPTPNQDSGQMFSLPDSQASATMQGIADEPANSKDVYLTPLDDSQKSLISGGMIEAPVADRTPKQLTLDEQIAQREQGVRDATDAPVEKQSFWKDFGAKLIQGADAFFNGNRAPIVGWGRLKHDQAIQNANAKLNPLIAQKKQEQEFAYNDARVGKFKADQENQVRDDNDRFVQSIRKRKYYDPAKATVAEKTRLATMNLKPEDLGKWDDRDPKTVKWGDAVWQYDADKKAWVESGIAKDPTLKPEVYEVDETDADGKVIKNADGTPRTRKFVTTSKGGAALQEYANSRKASLRLGQDRLTETKRGNKVREDLAQKQFDEAKSRWQETMQMRAEAMTRKDAATAAGNAADAQKADLELQKYNEWLKDKRFQWKKGIGTGGFDAEDYEELTGEKP